MVPSILVEFASRPGAKVSCQFLSDLNSHDTGFHYQTVFFFSLESHVLTVNSCNQNFCVFVAGFMTLKNGKLNKEKKEGWGPSRRHRSNKYPLRMMNCNTNLYTPGQLDRVRKIIKNHHAIIFIKNYTACTCKLYGGTQWNIIWAEINAIHSQSVDNVNQEFTRVWQNPTCGHADMMTKTTGQIPKMVIL